MFKVISPVPEVDCFRLRYIAAHTLHMLEQHGLLADPKQQTDDLLYVSMLDSSALYRPANRVAFMWPGICEPENRKLFNLLTDAATDWLVPMPDMLADVTHMLGVEFGWGVQVEKITCLSYHSPNSYADLFELNRQFGLAVPILEGFQDAQIENNQNRLMFFLDAMDTQSAHRIRTFVRMFDAYVRTEGANKHGFGLLLIDPDGILDEQWMHSMSDLLVHVRVQQTYEPLDTARAGYMYIDAYVSLNRSQIGYFDVFEHMIETIGIGIGDNTDLRVVKPRRANALQQPGITTFLPSALLDAVDSVLATGTFHAGIVNNFYENIEILLDELVK